MKSIEKIETFLILADCGSFTETAKRLYLSQPTVSNHIQHLEEQFNAALFHRSRKSIQLTKEGEIFLGYAKQMKHLVEEASSKISNAGKLDHILSIYVSSYIGTYYFSDILREFHKHHPKQLLEIFTYCYEDLIRSLKEEKTDFAFMPIYPEDEFISRHFDTIDLFTDELVLVIPVEHPLADRKVLYARDLRGETVLLPQSGQYRQYIYDQMKEHQIKTQYLQMSSFDMIKQAVKSQLGIAFLPTGAVAGEIERGELLTAQVASLHLTRRNGLVIRKQTQLSETATVFRHHVHQYFHAQ